MDRRGQREAVPGFEVRGQSQAGRSPLCQEKLRCGEDAATSTRDARATRNGGAPSQRKRARKNATPSWLNDMKIARLRPTPTLAQRREKYHRGRLSQKRLHLGDTARRGIGRLPGGRFLAIRKKRDRDGRRRTRFRLSLLQVAPSTPRSGSPTQRSRNLGHLRLARSA